MPIPPGVKFYSILLFLLFRLSTFCTCLNAQTAEFEIEKAAAKIRRPALRPNDTLLWLKAEDLTTKVHINDVAVGGCITNGGLATGECKVGGAAGNYDYTFCPDRQHPTCLAPITRHFRIKAANESPVGGPTKTIMIALSANGDVEPVVLNNETISIRSDDHNPRKVEFYGPNPKNPCYGDNPNVGAHSGDCRVVLSAKQYPSGIARFNFKCKDPVCEDPMLHVIVVNHSMFDDEVRKEVKKLQTEKETNTRNKEILLLDCFLATEEGRSTGSACQIEGPDPIQNPQ